MSEYLAVMCYSCEAVGHIKYISRARWVCQLCGRDNSVYIVLLHEAVTRNNTKPDQPPPTPEVAVTQPNQPNEETQ